MKYLSDILFIISNGLLIPVVALLLFLLVKAGLLLFGFYGEYRQRKRIAAMFRQLTHAYSSEELMHVQTELKNCANSSVVECFNDLLAHRDDRIYCEHLLADFQVEVQKQLSGNRMLIKFGPMLGLMGTLIPMGPALVGLASGDIASMAYNMQVAFATTVVGMAVAAVGLATLQVSQRFYARSFNYLEFIFNKLFEQ
jgi:hypothetical protein